MNHEITLDEETKKTRSAAEIQELIDQLGRHTGDVYIADDVNIRELAYEGVGE